MLDDYQRVAQISESQKGIKKLHIVALVKSYARLVEDIQNARKRAAYLGGKPYALAFAARKGRRAAGKGQIAQSYVAQKVKTVVYFLYNAVRDKVVGLAEKAEIGKFGDIVYREVADLHYVLTADSDRQSFLFKSFALARGAVASAHIPLDIPLDAVGRCLGVSAL